MKRVAVLCGVLLLSAAPLLAEDLFVPDWWGEPGTTFQGWDFFTDEPNPLPDGVDNPYGPPEGEPAMITPLGDWLPEMMPFEYDLDAWVGFGVWPLSGEMIIPISNVPVDNEIKIIWVQLTWMPQQDPASRPTVEEVEWNGGPGTIINEMPLGPDWWHTTYEIILPFNPDHEEVFIWGDIYVDEVVIDTWCTPEPATLGLLAAGGLMMLVRRRRR